MNGYYITIKDLLKNFFTPENFINELNKITGLKETINTTQGKAWNDCFLFLRKHLSNLIDTEKEKIYLVFEYKLNDGTKPDLLIICQNKLLIIEFKTGTSMKKGYLEGYLNQINNYYDKITRFNKPVWEKLQKDNSFSVIKYLVFTAEELRGKILADIEFVKIGEDFKEIVTNLTCPLEINLVENLLDSDYLSSPNTLELLSKIITEENLPDIFNNTKNISNCNQLINSILNHNKAIHLNIVIIKGNPGSGKTALGFSVLKDVLNNWENQLDIKYITGNGNLYKIFSKIINDAASNENATYVTGEQIKRLNDVCSIETFLNYFSNNNDSASLRQPIIKSDVIIFDEAQRAWNSEQVAIDAINKKNRNRINLNNEQINMIMEKKLSQPYTLLHSLISSIKKSKKSKTIICLIGNGQEIHKGEEHGEKEWIRSIKAVTEKFKDGNHCVKTRVYIPFEPNKNYSNENKIENLYKNFNESSFQTIGLEIIKDKNLYLQNNKRGYEADSYLKLVDNILNNNSPQARQLFKALQNNYHLRITQDFEEALNFVNAGDKNETRGLLSNSYEGNWGTENKFIEIQNKKYFNVQKKLENWFINKESNKLRSYVNEFNCQGLELDRTILLWGKKMLITTDGNWKINTEVENKALLKYFNQKCNLNGIYDKDVIKEQFNSFEMDIVKNTFRVLLTRGRKGIILYVEDDSTFKYFRDKMGLKVL